MVDDGPNGIGSRVMEERRRHVRAKPTPALPAQVLQTISPAITESLDVVDISVSGLALLHGLKAEPVGSTMKLRLVLPGGTHAIEGIVRWVANGMLGLELVDPAEETAKAVRRYVGELLERGG
jgi:hypothetical protein